MQEKERLTLHLAVKVEHVQNTLQAFELLLFAHGALPFSQITLGIYSEGGAKR